MSERPIISIVIPVYNKAQSVEKSIRSVLNQTFKDFEVIVVDDGSTDNSIDEIAKIRDNRIRIISQENSGVSAARNRGIAESRGETIAFLDADDQWDSDYLEAIMLLIKTHEDCKVFATGYRFKDQYGRIAIPKIINLSFEGSHGLLDNYFRIASCSHPPLWTGSVAVSKEALHEIGGFPTGIGMGEDLITWTELALRNKIAYLKEAKATYCLASQATRLTPSEPENPDRVGLRFKEILNTHSTPYLQQYAALWHKMRMVTFVQLNRGKDARREFHRICSMTSPSVKEWVWLTLSYLPESVVRFIMRSRSGFK